MEQNKLDSSQIIGFLFLIAAFISLLMFQPQIEEPIERSDIVNESNFTNKQPQVLEDRFITEDTNVEVLENEFITLENEDVIFTFSTKGAQISKSVLKKHNDLDGNFQEIINENQNFYFESSDLNNIDTSKMFFSYNVNESSPGKEINFSYIQESGETIFFNYFIPNKGYLLKLDVYTSGYNRLFSRNSSINLNWNLDSFKNSKSQDYENRYTYLNYQDSDKKVRDLSAYSDDDDIDSAKWISYSQHFFASIFTS